MADPLLHIRDSYYFEVPQFMWPGNYQSLTDIPAWVRDAYHVKGQRFSLDEWNEALAGKILIPQPFGSPKNLYEAGSGFCISRFMLVEVFIALVLIAIFVRVAKKIQRGDAPRGGFTNFFESFLFFLREDVAKPAIGSHDADRFVPLLWTIFFFVLGCNLMGLVPWVGNPTAEWAVTLTLALMTFAVVVGAGIARFGPVGYWLNQIPTMDLPWWMGFLKPIIWVIEIFGLLIKHAILSIRLLANMVAGHLVLLAVLGLIVAAGEAATTTNFQFGVVAVVGVLGSAAFTMLELFVAFLQAYIFTFLTALFIGAAIHHH